MALVAMPVLSSEFAFADFGSTNSPPVSWSSASNFNCLVSNYTGVNGPERYITVLGVLSSFALNNPSEDFFLDLKITDASALSTFSIYGSNQDSDDSPVGSGSAFYNIIQNKTDAYLDFASDGVDLGGSGGTKKRFNLQPIISEMVSHANRSLLTTQERFWFFLRSDIEQDLLLSANRAIVYGGSYSDPDRPTFYEDQPSELTIVPASADSNSQNHNALFSNGIGDSEDVGAEDFWYLPSNWLEVDKPTYSTISDTSDGNVTNLANPRSTTSPALYGNGSAREMQVWKRWGYELERESDGTIKFGGENTAARHVVSYDGLRITDTQDWSISFWVKHDSISGLGPVRLFGTDGYAGSSIDNGFQVFAKEDQNGPQLRVEWAYNTSVSRASLSVTNTVGSGWVAGEYHCWTIVASGDDIASIHLNGVEQAKAQSASATDTGWRIYPGPGYSFTGSTVILNRVGEPLFIGVTDPTKADDGTYSRFNGYLDDIRLYRRALTSQDIARLSSARGILGGRRPITVDDAEAYGDRSTADVQRHQLFTVGAQSSSENSQVQLGLVYELDPDGSESQSQNLAADISVPATTDSCQSQSQAGPGQFIISAKAACDSSQSAAQCSGLYIDVDGAANIPSLQSSAICEDVNLGVDKVGLGLGGESCWLSASRDNINIGTGETDNFAQYQPNLSVEPNQWVQDTNNGGDHAFTVNYSAQIVNLPDGIF